MPNWKKERAEAKQRQSFGQIEMPFYAAMFGGRHYICFPSRDCMSAFRYEYLTIAAAHMHPADYAITENFVTRVCDDARDSMELGLLNDAGQPFLLSELNGHDLVAVIDIGFYMARYAHQDYKTCSEGLDEAFNKLKTVRKMLENTTDIDGRAELEILNRIVQFCVRRDIFGYERFLNMAAREAIDLYQWALEPGRSEYRANAIQTRLDGLYAQNRDRLLSEE